MHTPTTLTFNPMPIGETQNVKHQPIMPSTKRKLVYEVPLDAKPINPHPALVLRETIKSKTTNVHDAARASYTALLKQRLNKLSSGYGISKRKEESAPEEKEKKNTDMERWNHEKAPKVKKPKQDVKNAKPDESCKRPLYPRPTREAREALDLGEVERSVIFGKTCDETIDILPHQLNVLKEFCNGKRDLLAVMGTGTGKTLVGILSIRLFLRTNLLDKALIACPANVVGAWKAAVDKHIPELTQRISIYKKDFLKRVAFNERDKDKLDARTFLIIDESHGIMRTKVDENKQKKKTCISDAAMACIVTSGGSLLLTGTPIVNSISDLKNTAGAFMGMKSDWTNYELRHKCPLEALSGKVCYYMPSPEEKASVLHMPLVNRYVLDRVMDEKQKKYALLMKEEIDDKADFDSLFGNDQEEKREFDDFEKAVFSKYNCFGSKQRISQNEAYHKSIISDTAKQDELKAFLAERYADGLLDPEESAYIKRGIIYSAFKTKGALLISKIVSQFTDKYQIIDGSVKASDRYNIVEQFNDGTVDILIFTSAGSEGLDLKGGSFAFLFDTAWNGARLEQALARVVRCRSHENLPERLRKVDVVQIIMRLEERSEEDKNRILNDPDLPDDFVKTLSIDERLSRYVAEKNRAIDHAYKVFASRM